MIKKIFAGLLALVGLSIGGLGVYLAVSCREKPPVLVTEPASAARQVEGLMDAICSGDYDGASAYLYGTPSLGAEIAQGAPGEVWEALTDSLSYTLSDDWFASDSGLSLNATVSSLEVSSVTERLKERTEALHEKYVREAENMDEVYDEKGEYSQAFADRVLEDGIREALKEDARQTTREITLHLVYEDGQWWVLAEEDFLRWISGGVAG